MEKTAIRDKGTTWNVGFVWDREPPEQAAVLVIVAAVLVIVVFVEFPQASPVLSDLCQFPIQSVQLQQILWEQVSF